MTPEQKDLFISMATLGVACGLDNLLEWYVNYDRTLDHYCKYEDIPKKEKEAEETMLAFLHQCGSAPDDPIQTWTSEDLHKAIQRHYNERRYG